MHFYDAYGKKLASASVLVTPFLHRYLQLEPPSIPISKAAAHPIS